jgi:hypothetical protein
MRPSKMEACTHNNYVRQTTCSIICRRDRIRSWVFYTHNREAYGSLESCMKRHVIAENKLLAMAGLYEIGGCCKATAKSRGSRAN